MDMSSIWTQIPNDIIPIILSQKDIPCDTKVAFKKQFGLLTNKVHVPDGLESKLNIIFKNRVQTPIVYGLCTLVYNGEPISDSNKIHMRIITLNEDTSHTPCYVIEVKKKKVKFVYSMIYDNEKSNWITTKSVHKLIQL